MLQRYVRSLDTYRKTLDRMRPAIRSLQDVGAHQTIAENFAVSLYNGPKRIENFGMALRSTALHTDSLIEPSMVGALQKMLYATACRLTFTIRSSDKEVVRFYPEVLDSRFFTFLDTYCSHNEDIRTLRSRMSNPQDRPRFEWLESETEAFGPASHSYFTREADNPEILKTEVNSGEYTLFNRHKIAANVFQSLVITYPHNSVLYHNELSIFRKMLYKSFLSSEEATQVFDQCMNKAWYGCEDEAVARAASEKMVKEHKVVSAYLSGIEKDITGYYKRHGFNYPENPSPQEFRIFRA